MTKAQTSSHLLPLTVTKNNATGGNWNLELIWDLLLEIWDFLPP
jgi:hypothetical protein